MNYMTPKEAAEKWSISLRRVQTLCTESRIPGVIHVGRQWMIPVTAVRPDDGRTKQGKRLSAENVYRFPIFVYSDSFVTRSGLNSEELRLLDAQILTLQGELLQSVRICRELSQNGSSNSIRFGAQCTNLYNYMLLGFYSDLMSCQNSMQEIYDSANDHREDYKMLLAAMKFEYTYDFSGLLEIDPARLSPEALLTFQCVTLLSLVFSGNPETAGAIRMYNATCEMLEKNGNYPAAMVFHGCLDFLCAKMGDVEGQQRHAEAVVRIGHREGLNNLISKYMSLDSAGYLTAMKAYGDAFESKIVNNSKNNIKSWKLIYSTYKEMPLLPDYSDLEREVLLLMSQGVSRKRIAELKGLSKTKLEVVLDEISVKSGAHDYAELQAYAEEVFSMTRNR